MSNERKGSRAGADVEARLTMKVRRRDGTVEEHATGWGSVSEEQKQALLREPGFRAWLKAQWEEAKARAEQRE